MRRRRSRSGHPLVGRVKMSGRLSISLLQSTVNSLQGLCAFRKAGPGRGNPVASWAPRRRPNGLKTDQNASKTASKGLADAIFSEASADIDQNRLLKPTWSLLGPTLVVLGSLWGPKTLIFVRSSIIVGTSTISPSARPRSPKMAQDGPKMAQDGPKMAPRWPQDDPRWSQDAPRHPKMVQDGPKMAQDGPKMAPRWKMRAR